MLFQKNILRKYLALLPAERIDAAWSTFQSYFLNADIQQNILQSKEEQFQEGFLRELFVKVLGYTLNPSPDFNLITEQKNETNSKKADGAILIDGKVVGIIELKDHKTPDLSKVETQAFGYKNQHPDARLERMVQRIYVPGGGRKQIHPAEVPRHVQEPESDHAPAVGSDVRS